MTQYHSISQGSDNYSFTAFTDFSDTSYTATYSLQLNDGSGTDAAALYSWLSISGNTITMNSNTPTDAGKYDLLISAQLDDSAKYPGDATSASVAVVIWLYSV